MFSQKNKRNYAMIFVFIIVFYFLALPINNVRAEVNKHYGEIVGGTNLLDNGDEASDDTGTIVGLLSVAVLYIGKAIESLVAWTMGLFSGTDFFPWADKIIFNTIPILDVNFINPAEGSLFGLGSGTDTIGSVIRNIYFTGLSIAVGFLSLVVAVMAIRMAITTIAAQKAKYKESIVALLTTIALLFGMHFLLSLVFYLNEKLVEVASQIVVDQTTEVKINGVEAGDGAILTGLGDFFYEKALADGGNTNLILIKIQKAAPIPTVIYLMFIIQSIMFLFAYFKRFFYVIILSIIAPFVIIYDFLGKAVS